ncbi:hypothetical protein PUN28_001994 [Cardiocondyla obscurior]|uniref:Uncharacterized protein n=1 Tax=Cardiocondyla obscurior TaxID=286306 RepID=A0AAW2GS60_9HYME
MILCGIISLNLLFLCLDRYYDLHLLFYKNCGINKITLNYFRVLLNNSVYCLIKKKIYNERHQGLICHRRILESRNKGFRFRIPSSIILLPCFLIKLFMQSMKNCLPPSNKKDCKNILINISDINLFFFLQILVFFLFK